MESLNLHHLNDWLIKPVALGRSPAVSFVEVIAETQQPAVWFVSHFWGEVIVDFLHCLRHHAQCRHLGNDDAFWICAYALRQHDLDADVNPDDLTATSFYEGMQATT